jgi:hypothetical protein
VLIVIRLMAVAGGTWAAVATADDCSLTGTCTAVPNPDDPVLGAWKCCVEVIWDTGSNHALSHIDVLLGLEACDCVCEEFPFAAQNPAGTSIGEEGRSIGCSVYYRAEWLCHGDPSLDIAAPLVKFEPIEQGSCHTTSTGEGLFCFHSDWPPVEVATPNELLARKAANDTCTGQLAGMVPDCSCGYAPVAGCTWGEIKARFTR